MNANQGTLGQHIVVKTNSFRLILPPVPHRYYHYDVITQMGVNTPTGPQDKVMSPGQRYTEIIEAMQDQYPNQFLRRALFDGVKNLYSLIDLQASIVFATTLNRQGHVLTFEVKLSLVSTIEPEIFGVLTAPAGAQALDQQPADRARAVNLLQVVVSQAPHIRYRFSLHAKSFYTRNALGDRATLRGVVALSGIFQSVRPVLGNVLINVDTTTAAFYMDGPVLDVARDFLRVRDVRDIAATCENEIAFESLRRFLLKVAVRARAGGKRRIIRDIVKRAGHISFKKGDVRLTVKQHYLEAHNKVLRYPDAFGLKFGSDAVFPAELWDIEPGQRYTRKLDPDQTQKFLKASTKFPEQRLREIMEAVRPAGSLAYHTSGYMQDAGLQVAPQPLQINARMLPLPPVQFGGGVQPMAPIDGVWNVRNRQVISPAELKGWGCLLFGAEGQIQWVDKFLTKLIANMRKLGMVVSDPLREYGNEQDARRSLYGFGDKIARARGCYTVVTDPRTGKSTQIPAPDLIVVVLPEHAAELRKVVKNWGDVSTGIPTQCVRTGKFSDDDQYCNNVALKINAKVKGINSLVPSPLLRQRLKGVMVVGCDVSHPAPGVGNRPSIASVVTSYNDTATRYNAYLDCQSPRQEVIEHLADMVLAGLRHYHNANDMLPDTILVYRDGVSEGEYRIVVQEEVGQLKKKLAENLPKKIQVVFIVVGKRHHVRFFPNEQRQGDRKGNCRPGLVVDTAIVHSAFPDFYLLSHAGIIGTSRPSHYVVLHNEAGWTPDELQGISYHLCYVYATATRAVSIPAPVYYADRACSRAGFHFDPSQDLPDFGGSSHEDDEFNLQAWRRHLKQAKAPDMMYFL